MKAKCIFLPSLLALIFCLTGCGVKIVNLTPETAPANRTGSYTLKAEAKTKKKTVDFSSMEAFVVINKQHYPMQMPTNGYFQYNYKAPANEQITRYYYVLNYVTQKEGEEPVSEQIISDLYQLQLPSTFKVSIDKKRAAVGTRVTVNGQNFTAEDRIFVDGMYAETIYISPSKLQFIVPKAKPDFGYVIEVRSPTYAQTAGALRIDAASPLHVLPTKLDLKVGQRLALAFALDYPAPYGGLYINVTTNIADSIIMPEVLIPEGARTVSASIEGAKAGNGVLFVNAKGLPELVIPVTVR